MAVLECSKTLLAAIKREPEGNSPPVGDDGRLGPWCASLLQLGRVRTVLYLCKETHLSFVLPLRQVTADLSSGLRQGVRETLILLGVEPTLASSVAESYASVRLARVSSPSWTAKLNAVAQDYKYRARILGQWNLVKACAAAIAENDRPRQALDFATARERTLVALRRRAA